MQDQQRVTALDGLRGWAALTVLANHLMQISPPIWAAFIRAPHGPWAHLLTWSPLHLFWAGGEAVILFFVLSGYVLAAPFWSGRGQSPAVFLIRRIFRIYPAFLVACIAAWLLARWLPWHAIAGTSTWFNQYWRNGGPPGGLITAALMGFGRHLNLNPALWSLVVEMRVSLIFPLIIWLMRRTGPWLLPVAIAFSALCKLAETHTSIDLTLQLWWTTGAQVWLFVLGAELARRAPMVVRLIRAAGPMIVPAGLVLLLAKWLAPLPQPATWFLSGLGAALLIACVIALPGVGRLFEARLSQALGRWSYSLYLFHFAVLAALTYGLTPALPLWVPLVLTPPVALAVAALSAAVIERPFIGWGRRVSGMMGAGLKQMKWSTGGS